jgi:hypothetical protein
MERNPWFTIWTQPKATMTRIVAENPNRSLWLLAAIWGFCSLLNTFQSAAFGNSMGTIGIFILAVLLSPFWGYLNFTVWSWFVAIVGKWFKGQGSFAAIRSAYAWSCVPIVLNIPLWLLMVMLFGHQLFLNFPDSHLLPNSQVTLLFVILVIKVVLAIWSLVIYLNGLAEVQHFSVLRAIGNVVVAGILLGVVLFVLWNLLAYAMGGVPAAFKAWNFI